MEGTKSTAQLEALASVEGTAQLTAETASESVPVLSTPFNLTDATGASSFTNGIHSGHQTRIVHTSHGDYIAYLSDEIKENPDENTPFFNEFSIIKVQDGQAQLLYQDYISYCSSSISIFADEKGGVYAATLTSNKFNSTPGAKSSVNLAVWHVDSQTDEVTGYTATIENQTAASYGYAQPVIDAANGKIYALFTRGNGDHDGYINWFIFDLATMSWEGTERSIFTDWRYNYHFAYADGKGGVVIVTERNALAENLGYPEIPSATLWPADYVWDQLDMFYIPDMYDDSVFYEYPVQEADYSRVADLDGDGKCTTEEERKVSEYPNTKNNHQGSTFLDSEGKLHVLYTIQYLHAAYDRSTAEETQWHVVFDISDPADVKMLSKQQLKLEGYIEDGGANNYEFRMAEASDGTLYIVAMRCDGNVPELDSRLLLYQLSKGEEGYDYRLIYTSERLDEKTINNGFSLADSRSLSVLDDTISMIYHTDGDSYISGSLENHGTNDWHYLTIRLPSSTLAIRTESLADATVESPYRQAVEVSYSGTGSLTYGAEGLPEGLSIDSSSGVLSGTPAVGTDVSSPYTVKVTVTDGTLTAVKELLLTVRQQGEFVITVTASEGGIVLPLGGQFTVMRGESKSFAIVADSGYAIAEVLVDGEPIGAVSWYTFENVTEDHSLQVRFQKKYDTSDGGSPSGSGSSDSDAGNGNSHTGDSQDKNSDDSGTKDNVSTGAVV